jgi:beta-galactosidase/beta-glucuronidase
MAIFRPVRRAGVHERRYPFPVDPPFVPDENPTGDYRRRFDVPADWRGRAACCASRASTRACARG